jgi:hypothetical protein
VKRITTLFLAAAALIGLWPTSPAAQSKGAEVGADRLVGRWVRPDGGYVLKIRSAQAGGRLEAAYLNPRSIKVARAEWRREEGRLLVFVELRDVNYPGSTYNLRFVPDKDRLVGAYYQAVQKQTFDVEFARQK